MLVRRSCFLHSGCDAFSPSARSYTAAASPGAALGAAVGLTAFCCCCSAPATAEHAADAAEHTTVIQAAATIVIVGPIIHGQCFARVQFTCVMTLDGLMLIPLCCCFSVSVFVPSTAPVVICSPR